MKPITFKYSKKIQTGKYVVRCLIILFVILFLVILLKNKPTNFSSGPDYYFAMSSPLIMVIGFVLYLGSWSDIEVVDSGLFVEFLGSKLYVPWDGIIELKHVRLRYFGMVIVLTKKEYLTPIHRIYSLITVGSFLPGFHIHTHAIKFHELNKLIEEHRSNSR
jgi:hypothetical protein